MSIDFAYAQARAQARLGERMAEDGWRVLESSLGLPQYLSSVRSTVLAPRVQHFSIHVTPHTIERTLREDWRVEVAAVGRWVPEPWQAAVGWTAWIPYIEAVAWLLADEPPLPWMHDDPVLSGLALDDPAGRRLAIAGSPFAALDEDDPRSSPERGWLAHWQSLWPATSDEESADLQRLVDAVRDYLAATARDGVTLRDRREARAVLVDRVTATMRRRIEQPVVVFCYLVLFALELQRLRDGLLRRALFNVEARERAA